MNNIKFNNLKIKRLDFLQHKKDLKKKIKIIKIKRFNNKKKTQLKKIWLNFKKKNNQINIIRKSKTKKTKIKMFDFIRQTQGLNIKNPYYHLIN